MWSGASNRSSSSRYPWRFSSSGTWHHDCSHFLGHGSNSTLLSPFLLHVLGTRHQLHKLHKHETYEDKVSWKGEPWPWNCRKKKIVSTVLAHYSRTREQTASFQPCFPHYNSSDAFVDSQQRKNNYDRRFRTESLSPRVSEPLLPLTHWMSEANPLAFLSFILLDSTMQTKELQDSFIF